jgi:tRNA threonylcarbamoyl adenosine modification protein (Sua5/YciO/YrdC/YwlC family)
MTVPVRPDGPDGRSAAIAALRAGGIVGVPTDTVYGIAVDLASPGGIERLFAAKHRPPERGIVLLLSEPAQAGAVGELDAAARALAEAFWPGGLTLVVNQLPGVALPAALTGGTRTIGLRVPDHDAPRILASALGPLPTTSANRSGLPDALTAAQVADVLGDSLSLVLDGGRAPGAKPSTVVDLTGPRPRIARVGAIPEARIREVLRASGLPEPDTSAPIRT